MSLELLCMPLVDIQRLKWLVLSITAQLITASWGKTLLPSSFSHRWKSSFAFKVIIFTWVTAIINMWSRGLWHARDHSEGSRVDCFHNNTKLQLTYCSFFFYKYTVYFSEATECSYSPCNASIAPYYFLKCFKVTALRYQHAGFQRLLISRCFRSTCSCRLWSALLQPPQLQ